MKTNPTFNHRGSRLVATSVSAENATGTSTFPRSIDTVIITDPARARAIPTEQISTYFQVASRDEAVRWLKMRGALARVVASIAIHITMM